jgi:hypothetical protein
MHKKIFYIALFFFLKSHICRASFTIETQNKVKNFCENYNHDKEFYQKTVKEILSQETLRFYLAEGLRHNQLPGCKKAFKDYLKKRLENEDDETQPGDQAFLSLGFLAKLPESQKIIEREIDKGLLSSWIDLLQKENEEAYRHALGKWITRVGQELRQKENAGLRAVSDYGKAPADGKGIKIPNMVRIWTPILMSRYLSDSIKTQKKLDVIEYGHLNIIFASTTTSYREIFKEEISKIIANNTTQWIQSYKKEPPWIQFRLLPLMQNIDSGDIKREVIWLSKHHQDPLFRTLAINTLEKIALKKNRPSH